MAIYNYKFTYHGDLTPHDEHYLSKQGSIPVTQVTINFDNWQMHALPVAYATANRTSMGGIYIVDQWYPEKATGLYIGQVSAAIIGRNLPPAMKMNLAEMLLAQHKLAPIQELVYQSILRDGMRIPTEHISGLPANAPFVIEYFQALVGKVI